MRLVATSHLVKSQMSDPDNHHQQEARRTALAAVVLFEDAGDASSLDFAEALKTLAGAYLACGEAKVAMARATQAQELFKKHGDMNGEGSVLAIIAQVYHTVQYDE